MDFLENVPLAPFTYYKIGGPARWLAQPRSIDDLRAAGEFIRANNIPFFILGAGSNILFDDAGFEGLVLHAGKLDTRLIEDPATQPAQTGALISLSVGASTLVIHLLRHCMKRGIAGLEFLAGIPGSMGGVFRMNAGTKLGEIKDAVTEVALFDLFTGKERTVFGAELAFSYRQNHFVTPSEIILRGKLRGALDDPKAVQDQVTKLLDARKRTQPIDKPSCGSVFCNPDPENGVFAWKLIDQAGLRGYRIGNAEISRLHTNFIVNLGGASAADVRALIAEAKARVKAKFGIELHEEVLLVGRASPTSTKKP